MNILEYFPGSEDVRQYDFDSAQEIQRFSPRRLQQRQRICGCTRQSLWSIY